MSLTKLAVSPRELKWQAESQIVPEPYERERPIKYDQVCGFTGLKNKMDQLFSPSTSKIALNKKSQGVLIFGPSGVGKTHFIEATASEYKVPLFLTEPSRILSMWEGQTEKNILVLIAAAEKSAEENESGKAIISLDAADLFLGSRNTDTRTKHVVFEAMESSRRVVWLASASDPRKLDPKFLSYFTEKIFMPLPDSEIRRIMLGRKFSQQKLKLDPSLSRELVKGTNRFSFRELGCFLDETCWIRFEKLRAATHWKKVDGREGLKWEIASSGDPNATVCNFKTMDFNHISFWSVPVYPDDIRKVLNRYRAATEEKELKRCWDFDIRHNGRGNEDNHFAAYEEQRVNWMAFWDIMSFFL